MTTLYGWTQPICESCYTKRFPGGVPIKMQEPEEEKCCCCGKDTTEGIYIRIDPHSISYPTIKRGE